MMKTIKFFLFIFLALISLQAIPAHAGSGSGSIIVTVAPTYTVTATATSGGTISPASKTVNSGSTTTFTVTPISTSDYVTTVTGCNGTLAQFQNPSTTYTTGAITANCTVSAVFTKKISAPTGLSATQSTCYWNQGRLLVSWNAVSGATSYTLKEGSTTLYTGSATSFNHTDLMPLSSHTYSVTASGASGTSSASTVTGKTLDVCPITAPKNFTATPGSCGTGTINLSWTDGDPNTTDLYLLKKGSNFKNGIGSNGCDGLTCTAVSPHTKTTFSDTGLADGSAQNYSITAEASIMYVDKTSHLVTSAPVSIGTVNAPSPCSYTVSTTAGTGGFINPGTQTIVSGSKATLVISPDAGYAINIVSGCEGNGSSLSGNTYTTAPVTANCTVSATFKKLTSPVCANGATNPPTCTTFPVCLNGATNYPICDNFTTCPAPTTQTVKVACDLKNGVPATSGQVTRSQTKTLPSCTFGTPVTNLNSTYVSDNCVYPPGVCANGATNYPTCTIDKNNICLNMANNPPICNTFDPCSNGATNPPLCNNNISCKNGANNPPTCTTFTPCANGATNPPACNSFGMSGTLNTTDCTIIKDGSSCNTNLTWSTTSPVGTSAVTTPDSITVKSANSSSGTNYPVSIGPGNRTFYLYNNAILLAQGTATSTCVSGTEWDGSSCVASAVAGGWDNGTCGSCDATCNMQCTKLCNNPAPLNGGALCPGDTTGSGVWNYQLSCTGGLCPLGGGAVDSGVLGILFMASPSQIFKGRSSTLSWTSIADSCTSLDFDTGGKPNGSVTVSPTKSKTYTLTCNGSTQESKKTDVKVSSITVIER